MNINVAPLVSIVVVTYNSEKYIYETLESIKNQTYNKIELIVTDDASSDNTIYICSKWLKKYNKRFENVELISEKKNTGITINCLRGYKKARGEWIKPIAGDDILEYDCIENNLKFVNDNVNIKVVQSSSKYYKDSFLNTNYIKTRNIQNELLAKGPKSVYFQRKVLLLSPSVNAPTVFINKKYIESIGYLDNKIVFMEDWPLWIKINNSNNLIYSFKNVTVKYRIHSKSISNNEHYINKNFEELYKFQRQYLWDELNYLDKLFINYEYIIKKIWILMKINGSNVVFKAIYVMLLKFSDFYRIVRGKYYKWKYS